MDLRKRGCFDVDWTILAYIRGHFLLLPGRVMNPMFQLMFKTHILACDGTPIDAA
jgi:hypothetical protein